MISFAGVLMALVAAKLITFDSFGFHRLSVLFFQFRTFFDALDGIVARNHMGITRYNHNKDTGHTENKNKSDTDTKRDMKMSHIKWKNDIFLMHFHVSVGLLVSASVTMCQSL